MDEPRFNVGQMVVIIDTLQSKNRHLIGHVGVVEKVNPGPWGPGYRISGTEKDATLGFHGSCLRPYDPPASWDDEDMVWKPEAIKETEKA